MGVIMLGYALILFALGIAWLMEYNERRRK